MMSSALSTSDFIYLGLLQFLTIFFTVLFGRWANRILDNLEKKAKKIKEKLKK